MRFGLSLMLAGIALGAHPSAHANATAATSLHVTYWEDGSRARQSVTWELRCNPPRGSHPRPVRSCRKLAAGGVKLFAPTPKNVACTEIYGGPQRARVVGVVAGRRVWTTFTRIDGCAIGRWDRIAPWLVPPGGVS